jgi:hypothetical protein
LEAVGDNSNRQGLTKLVHGSTAKGSALIKEKEGVTIFISGLFEPDHQRIGVHFANDLSINLVNF